MRRERGGCYRGLSSNNNNGRAENRSDRVVLMLMGYHDGMHDKAKLYFSDFRR